MNSDCRDGPETETAMPFDVRRYTHRRLPMRIDAARRVGRYMHKATSDPANEQGTWAAALMGIKFRRDIVDGYLRECYGGLVQSGPFKGMRYGDQAAGSMYSPKILGSYEQELHPYIAALPGYRRFVDIGCGEGYYAVGARLLAPGVEVHAFDVDPNARRLCAELAAMNGVAEGLRIGERCEAAELEALAAPGTLVLIDIEAAEVELLAGLDMARMACCDILVETHSTPEHGLTLEPVVDALSANHEVAVIDQQPRDWSAVPELLPLANLDRFLAQWEGHSPEPWVFAKARGGS